MSIVDMIKTMANDTARLQAPVNVLFGTIVKAEPIEIDIHEKLKLNTDFIVMTKTAKDAGLVAGDAVALLRVQGGQQYMVIDKVVD